MPDLPNAHAVAVMVITGLALVLFTRDRIPLETSSLLIFITLLLLFQFAPFEGPGGVLQAKEFFQGFGHEALVTIAALMIVGKGLETTGALQPLAVKMANAWMKSPRMALLATLLISGVLSAFLNNTPIVVMLMPMLVGVALRTGAPVSGILMPMGFATLIGGMGTSIGTSTNLLVVNIAADMGQRPIQLFDFSLPVAIVGSVGLLYLWLVAPRMLPDRRPPLADTSPRIFDAYLHISDASFANGKTLSEVRRQTHNRMRVDRIQRGDGLVLAKLPSVRLQSGDRLLVRDTRERLKEFEQVLGVTLHDVFGEDVAAEGEARPVTEAQQMAEVVVTRGSILHQRSLGEARFTSRYKLMPLAVHRARTAAVDRRADISDAPLRAGDVILVQGSRENIRDLKNSGQMLVLDGTTDLPHTHRAPRAIAIMALVVIAAALGWMPISVAALCGVGLMLATHCLNWRSALSALSAPVILIIVTSLALGLAMMRTGAADYLAQVFVAGARGMSVPVVLSALMLLMAIITNVVSNNAAAVVGTPVAIAIAQTLGAPAEPFVLAVLFGANMSYATPIGYQTNLLILSTGGYKFSDFMRVGLPLTLIMWLGFSIILPIIYDL